MDGIDTIPVNFSQTSAFYLNIALALVIFGVALDIKIDDFKRIFRPGRTGGRVIAKAPLIGLVGQFLLFPAATFLLASSMTLPGTVALGLIILAACPGGNLSNYVTHLGKGNSALSISMTAISTAAAVIMTPFNISFWASMNPAVNEQIASRSFRLDPVSIGLQILLLLLVPLGLGMLTAAKAPRVTRVLKKFLSVFSVVVFFVIVVGAIAANWGTIVAYADQVWLVVLVQNLLGLGLGFVGATLLKLETRDRRAVTIEVGMQNTTLGLLLMVTQFPAEMRGGMMMVGAMWGIWGNITGFLLAYIWRRRTARAVVEAGAAA